MDGANGRPGNGPSTAVSYSGNFLAGTAFKVTADNLWFEGYWWWVCNSGQQAGAQSFALWQVDKTGPGRRWHGHVWGADQRNLELYRAACPHPAVAQHPLCGGDRLCQRLGVSQH